MHGMYGNSLENSETTVDSDCGHPLVFVSSFFKEWDYSNFQESPLWRLRQELAALNDEESFRRSLPLNGLSCLTWVVEVAEPDLSAEENKLSVADRLVEVLRSSEIYICILADRRRGCYEHGSPISFENQPTAVSYFEIELYAAAMYNKKIIPFVLEGFDPGPRLKAILEMLGWAFPEWCQLERKKPKDILEEVRRIIRNHLTEKQPEKRRVHKRLVEALFAFREGGLTRGSNGESILFLDGYFENRPLPDKERVEGLIKEYKGTQNFTRKLNRLWLTIRELMPASYLPIEVKQRSVLKEFLPYWDCVLGDWATAAAWHGWHGHLYAGTIAPLTSQVVIRSQGCVRYDNPQASVILPPDGALASAYYSIAKHLGVGFYYYKSLIRAYQFVNRAIRGTGCVTDGLLAIRGSIRLRMGWWPGAVRDFSEMLRLREKSEDSEEKIADALMHLGSAYAFCRRGRIMLEESVEILSKYPDNPNLARAKRKLAWAYRISCRKSLYNALSSRANLDAQRLGAYDQTNR